MKNVLLTGGSGFLGGIIRQSLITKAGINNIEIGRKVGKIQADIRLPFSIDTNEQIDYIIHGAGKAHSVPKTKAEKQAFYDINFDGTRNLCHALEVLDHLPKSFIFLSTVAVYGADQGINISENHPLKGYTPYAHSKILAEQWLEEWTRKHNVTLGILRLPLVAGPCPPGNLGTMVESIRSGKYLSIGKANARKSMVWAEDVANIIPVLAEKGGGFNLTDGNHPTFEELESAISIALNKRSPIKIPYWAAKGLAMTGDIIGPRFPVNSDKLKKITSTLTFDDSKARNELGWSPTSVLSKVDELVRDL